MALVELDRLAKRYQTSISAVALAFILQKKNVSAVIVGISQDPSRISDTFHEQLQRLNKFKL